MLCTGVVPRFSNLEVIALSLTTEKSSVDSESCIFFFARKI